MVNEAPKTYQYTNSSVTFHYEGQRWIRSQLVDTNWPDINRVLSVPSNQVPIHEGLFDALTSVKPFCNEVGDVWLKLGKVSTSSSKDDETSFEVSGLVDSGKFHIDMLRLLDGVAVNADFTGSPVIFTAPDLIGAIIGKR